MSGETAIGHLGARPERLWIEPPDCEVNPAVVAAIRDADAIIIGPGSLYTSVIPNFLIPGVREAIEAARVPKVFVCNVATQEGEPDGFTASDHLRVFEWHTNVTGTHFLENQSAVMPPLASSQEPIVAERPSEFAGCTVIAELVDPEMATHHDSDKLAKAVLGIAGRRSFWWQLRRQRPLRADAATVAPKPSPSGASPTVAAPR